MGLNELEEDKYINCYYYILEANYLYNNIKFKENKHLLHKDDLFYIENTHKYINSYELYRKKLIKNYIIDLYIYKKLLNI